MIRNNVEKLMHSLDFPVEAINELLKSLDKLLLADDFAEIVNRYRKDDFDFVKMVDDTTVIADKISISHYTAHMLLFLSISPILLEKYKINCIDDGIFYDTIRDLKYKLDECYLVYGVYGSMTTTWYERIFRMKTFALGRLQFEINKLWFDCEVNGRKLPKGKKVLSVHIPRTGIRLDHDLVLESYDRAKLFFKDYFENDIVFICNSWLLYPWNRTIYKDGSNLAKFYDDFTIVSSGDYKNYSEVWRLFDCLYDGNIEKLPSDTSIRRAFIKRMKNAEPIGHGTGIIVV